MKQLFTILLCSLTAALMAQCPVATNTMNGATATTVVNTCVGTTLHFETVGNVPSGAGIDWYIDPSNGINPPLTGTLIGSTNATAAGCPVICPSLLAIFINACNGTGNEQNNEYMVLSSGSGFAVNTLQIDYPNNTAGVTNNDVNINANPCGIQVPQASLIASLQAGSCNASNIIAAPPGTTVPSGAIVIFFASANVTATYDFSALCATGQQIYIIQSACNRASGAFVNQANCSANANNRLRKTIISLSTCLTCRDSLTYSRCGLSNQDGEYAIKVIGSDTSTVANGGILINNTNPCNGANFTTLPVPADTLRFNYTVPNTYCNTTQYIRGVMNPAPAGCVGGYLTQAFAVTVQCPTAAINGQNAICANTNTTLTANILPPNLGIGGSFLWNTGLTTNTITVQPTTTTTYTVTVTSTAGCTSTASHTVTLNPLPPPPIITGSSTWCAGQTNTLGTATPYSSYLWFDNTTGATTVANGIGTYSVTVTDANTCSTIGSVIVASGIPAPIITGSLVICNGTNTSLTAAGGVTYIWNTNGTTATIFVNPTTTTIYTVTATSASGCTATATTQVVVNNIPTPTIAATPNTPLCVGQSTVLTATGGNIYLWNDGTTGATHNFTATPLGNATYTVTVTNFEGCTATTSYTITVNPPLTPPIITGNTTLCTGNSTTLGTQTTYASYQWSTGTVGATISVTPAATATYTVIVTGANGCTLSTFTTVIVYILPTVTINGNTNPICVGASLTLTVPAIATNTYVWSNGSTSGVNTVTPTQTTTYTVTTTSTNGCTAINSTTIVVNYLPTLHIIGVVGACLNSINNWTVATTADTYQWSNGLGNTAIVTIPTANTGTYTYTVTVTNSTTGCSATSSRDITVSFTTATITNKGAASLCKGSSTQLSTGFGNYVWSTGSTAALITVTPTQTTTYTVTATGLYNCTATATITIIVNNLPNATISGDNALCSTYTGSLTANGGDTYIWTNSLSNNAGLSITPTATTTYTVTVTNSTTGCSTTATHTVIVNPLPIPHISPDTTIILGGFAQLYASGAGANGSYIWLPATYLNNNTTQNPISTPPVTTTYRLHLVTAAGCHNVDDPQVTVTVKTEELLGCLTQTEGFTPNNDNRNDTWQIPCVSNVPNEVMVFNRWGQLVFKATNYDGTWNGTDGKQALPDGTYYYVIKTNDYTVKGSVSILR
jgi:gliding motility-associated-like protein